jgi:O-antigen ligase
VARFVESALARELEHVLPGLLAFALIVATARAGGVYGASTWGWAALGPLLVLGAAFALSERWERGLADITFVGALLLFVCWTVLSTAWSDSVPRTVSEAERDLVYIAAVAAILVVATRQGVAVVTHGVLAGVTAVCGYSLVTRLFPDRFGFDPGLGYRLSRPIGYWNGLGLIAAMGIVLALGATASARRASVRALTAAAVVVLVATLYFTFSRGAWAALVVGLAVALALERDRWRVLVITVALTPFFAAAVWFASRAPGLNNVSATPAAATHDGHLLALALAALALLAAVTRLLLVRLEPKMNLPRVARAAVVASLVGVALAISVAGLLRAGGPQALWSRTADAFRASPSTPSSNLQDRLFTVSGQSRSDYWSVAWSQASAHPWLGSGAGTYDLYWTRERPLPVGALDAHSLYLETLAELGPAGLLLLAGFLAVPLLALRHARGQGGVAAAAGAYCAYLLATGVDWDWELPTVTLVALFCGAAVVAAARGAEASVRLGPGAKAAALVAVLSCVGAAVVVQVGNGAIDDSARLAASGRYDAAAAAARRATRWSPWSSAGWLSLARAERARGDAESARASLRKALARDPHDWRLWYELALVSEGPAKAAAEARVRSLNPDAPATVGAG